MKNQANSPAEFASCVELPKGTKTGFYVIKTCPSFLERCLRLCGDAWLELAKFYRWIWR